MRTLSIIASLVAVASLSACGQKPAASAKGQLSDQALKAEVDRCANGGMEAASDPNCKKASDENFRRFLEKDPKR